MIHVCFFLGVLCLGNVWGYRQEDLHRFQDQVRGKEPIRCAGYDLSGADLRGLQLKKADFSGASLRGTNLAGANLRKANLRLADLQDADFTDSVLDGALFKDNRLGGMIYKRIKSAKGTFLCDKAACHQKMAFENRLRAIADHFLSGERQEDPERELWENRIETMSLTPHMDMENIYMCLMETLQACHNKECLVVDFRQMQDALDGAAILEDCLFYLKTPIFGQWVRDTRVLPGQGAFVCFLTQTAMPEGVNPVPLCPSTHRLSQDLWGVQGVPVSKASPPIKREDVLDLHGPNPIWYKRALVRKLIIGAYTKNRTHALIITGRGLHNPEGRMGVLLKCCRNFLRQKKFSKYIEAMKSVNKNGALFVTLKPKKSRHKRELAQKQT